MRQIDAYIETQNEIVSPREAERQVFERVTADLREAANVPGRTATYHQAVLNNRRLWAALVCDVADPTNTLSNEMKSWLLSLATFVERESSALHSGNGDITALIDVNQAIIAGLSPA